MANGDDGMSEVGGGGSVGWRVEVNNGNIPQTQRKDKPGPWGYIVHDSDDVDGSDLSGRFFHIKILPPKGPGVRFGYNKTTGTFDIYVPIDNTKPVEGKQRQIRVMWAMREANVPDGIATMTESTGAHVDKPHDVRTTA